MHAESKIICIVFIIILIILILFNVYYKNDTFDKIMRGMWMAPDDFCKDSDIDGMMIYIGPNISSVFGMNNIFSEKRIAYLIMHAHNTVIVNKPIEILVNLEVNDFLPNNVIIKNAIIQDREEGDPETCTREIPLEEIMPKNIEITIYPEGRMTWINEEKKYAEFYKNNFAAA